MQVPCQLPGFTAHLTLDNATGKTRRGVHRFASQTQSRIHPQDACCGSGTCIGGCACVSVPFLGQQCHCLGFCA
jgi:hypothetical protein